MSELPERDGSDFSATRAIDVVVVFIILFLFLCFDGIGRHLFFVFLFSFRPFRDLQFKFMVKILHFRMFFRV